MVYDKYLCIVYVAMKVYTKNWPTRKRIDRFDLLQVIAIDLNLIPTPYFKRQTIVSASVQTYQRHSVPRFPNEARYRGARARSHSVSSTRITSGFLLIRSVTLISFFLSFFLYFSFPFFLVYFCAWSYHTFRKCWLPKLQWDDSFINFFKVYIDIETTMQRDRS